MWPGQAFMVGENGPEIFHAPGRGNIVPTSRGGGGGRSVVVNMAVYANDPGAFRMSRAQALSDAMRAAKLRN